jgi:putative heme iron utilization protein
MTFWRGREHSTFEEDRELSWRRVQRAKSRQIGSDARILDDDEEPDEASMTAIDRLGFHLRLRTRDRVHGRRIAFPREVKDTNDARAVLIEMIRACS